MIQDVGTCTIKSLSVLFNLENTFLVVNYIIILCPLLDRNIGQDGSLGQQHQLQSNTSIHHIIQPNNVMYVYLI